MSLTVPRTLGSSPQFDQAEKKLTFSKNFWGQSEAGPEQKGLKVRLHRTHSPQELSTEVSAQTTSDTPLVSAEAEA